jgi:signal transduction histidine kinase
LQDADERATEAARRAARATAQALRAAIFGPRALELATASERFTIRDRGIVVPPELESIDVRMDSDRSSLSSLIAGTIDELDRDPTAHDRLERIRPDLPTEAQNVIDLALAWHEHRTRADAKVPERLARIEAALATSASSVPRSTAAGLAILRATRREAVAERVIDRIAQGSRDEAGAVATRMGELGATSDSATLLARSAQFDSQRERLNVLRDLLPALLRRTDATALVVDRRILLYRPLGVGDGDGAWLEPLELAARAQSNAELLVVPWSGEARAGSSADWIDVVPGGLAIEPAVAQSDRNASLGVLLLLGACAVAFVAGWFSIRRALRRERDAVRTRTDFLTTVTHELRTPVAAMRLLAERLDQGRVQGDARRAEYHAMLASEATRLSTMIENVLDLGRIERGERGYDLQSTDAHELLQDIARVFQTIARAHGAQFVAKVECAGSLAKVDRGALTQAVLNLCDNARKYGGDGGPIELTATATVHRIEIRIADHGPGIPAADRARIFERFARGSEHRHGSIPGAGLGLYLARAIAQAHGGDLVLEPSAGERGARFLVWVPRVG